MEQQAAKIQKTLSSKFVHSDKMADILALAFQAQKNVIIWGPAGHAKSEMTDAVIKGLGLNDQTFVQFFGEGMTEDKLFGGMDFKALEEDHKMIYHPENSFLNRDYAVFEELFDAPAVVLTALKDTLTAHEMRNGNQRYGMKTRSIICLTNKSPNEISDLGASAHALVERFPFQLELRWDSYDKDDYYAMFKKLGFDKLGEYAHSVAQFAADASRSGNFISPRTAVHAMEAVIAAAITAGRDRTSIRQEDMFKLLYIPELSTMAEDLSTSMERLLQERSAEKQINALREKYQVVSNAASQEFRSPISALKVARQMDEMRKELKGAKLPDQYCVDRDDMTEECRAWVDTLKNQAFSLTRI